jgi:WD40 repeat protein
VADHTIAALEAAAVSNTLDAWLATLPDASRALIQRAIEMDRRLWVEHPASLASCLLARTLGLPELSALHEAWAAELDARGAPWVRPLRALPVDAGLVAELHDGAGLSLRGLQRPRFLSDEVLVLEAIRHHPSVQAPELRRRDRLRWTWARGEAILEPAPDEPVETDRYPRFESDGWGPVALVRAPGADRETLPCPEGGSAYGRFSSDGRRLFVYGTHDEYAGGFVYVLDADTLEIERRLETDAPVWEVHGCERDALLLIRSGRGLWVASSDDMRPLPLDSREACLSPSGRFFATTDGGLRIWSLAETGNGKERSPAGFPTSFDPSGNRLLSGRQLYDGRTGAPVVEVAVELANYLEGGPASPWFHLGDRFIISLDGTLCVWEATSGVPVLGAEKLRFPYWYSVAYDRAGTRLAALRQEDYGVALYELPSGRAIATIAFDIGGTALAMSADAIALQCGTEVEVRSMRGELRRRFTHPGEDDEEDCQPPYETSPLRFSADGRFIASFRKGDGWRIWALDGDEARHLPSAEAIDATEGFAPPTPRDWDIEAGTKTVFTHRPTGTRIALPVSGPWVANPADPRYLACDGLHVELRGR